MKLRLSLVCLSLAPALLRAGAVDSHITAATVYSDRAVVSREAHIDAAAGQQVLVFENLPESLREESLQVTAHGTAVAAIVDVNAATAYLATAPEARVKSLEDDIKGLASQIGALDDRASVLAEERNFVKRMMVAETAPTGTDASHAVVSSPRPSIEDWQKLYSYSDESLLKIATELRAIEEQKAEISAKKAAAEQQLSDLKGNAGKSVKNVTVRLDIETAGALDVVIKYSLPGARWHPSYDARVRSSERTIDLSYYGLVRNSTGEDWDKIDLTLSTARPSMGGAAPELNPWVVDEEPMNTRMEKSYQIAMPRAELAADASSFNQPTLGAGKLEAYNVTADVQTNATSATFKIHDPVSIASDNSVQKVSISNAKLQADLRYEATPKLMEAAFLTATAYNRSDYPYLAGVMNTFLDDTFIAASHMGTVMPGEKFDLHLGVDEAIVVSRKVVNRFTENTGITNNGKRVTYDLLVTVTNNRKTTEKVTFKEPLPISRNEKIVVKLIAPEEGEVGTKESPKEVTREDSILTWNLELRPGEKREVPIKFSVDYPADMRITGLD
jgi:uncharacterized protein (TIGR02231 family)